MANMADMQEGHTNTNIPEFTEEANTCTVGSGLKQTLLRWS